jgi:FG-GAP-like repeat/Secretion system C-terminal sorting domain
MKLSCFGIAILLVSLPLITSAQWTRHDISDNLPEAFGVTAGDYDGDGDVDVIACAYSGSGSILYFENGVDGWIESTLDVSFYGTDLVTADMDNDGDLDIVGCANVASQVSWWENDGAANFARHDLTNDFAGPIFVDVGDVNLDGLLDVACAGWSDDSIIWWENIGSGEFLEHTLTSNFNNAHDVAIGDVDGDEIPDFVGCSGGDDTVRWWRNNNDGTWTEHVISQADGTVSAVQLIDVDADGDNDLYAGVWTGSEEILFLSNDGAGNFTELALPQSAIGSWDLCVTDLGQDDDQDVFSTSYDSGIFYWEYVDGEFERHVLVENWDRTRGIRAIDMDGDHDDDILAASENSGEVAWWEQPGSGVPDLIELEVFPRNPPVIIPAGGTLTYDIHVASNLPQTVHAYIWTWAEMPNGQVFGPIDYRYAPFTPTLNIFFTGLTQDIPTLAPTGVYHWNVSIGSNLQTPVFTDGFSFTVIEPELGGGELGWTSNGWDDLDFAGEADETVAALPSQFDVSEVYPNPFNSSTRVSVTLPDSRHLTVQAFDNLGRQVAELANGQYSAGVHELTFAPSGLASGIYFMLVDAGGELAMRKLVYMK